MAFHDRTLALGRERVQDLCRQFDLYAEAFDAERLFTGPSLYFHLASWGLHRMGPGNAKLADLPEMIASFPAQRRLIATGSLPGDVSALCHYRESVPATDSRSTRVRHEHEHDEGHRQCDRQLWSPAAQDQGRLAEGAVDIEVEFRFAECLQLAVKAFRGPGRERP